MLFVIDAPLGCHGGAGDFDHVPLWDVREAMTGLHLLFDQRFGRRHENDVPGGIPPPKVVHDDGSDQGFA